MSDLPFIEYDWYFVPGKWELPQWRLFYHSYLFRLYTTLFPIWRHERKGDSEEFINHELFRTFLRITESEKTSLVVVYLPDKTDYELPLYKETSSLRFLRSYVAQYYDLRPCLDAVDANDRFIPNGSHYSLSGSIAIARCIVERLPRLGLHA